MVKININVNSQRAYRKLQRLEKEIGSVSRIGVKQAGELAKLYAKSIAPYKSGKTMRAITTKGSNQYKTKIVAKDGHPEKYYAGKTGRKFNLTYWLHFSAKAESYIKHGEAKFMFLTYAYINKKFKIEMRKQFYQMAAKINKR